MPDRKKRGCPACGGKPLWRLTTKGVQHMNVCANSKCGLPVALWPRFEAAMRLADLIENHSGLSEKCHHRKLARKVLGKGGKR
jgi:hypothetical protein